MVPEFLPGGNVVMNILLVDDDPIYLSLLGEILTLYGHSVNRASDGEAAIALLKREHIDLIISDVSMPKMNGVHLHTSVRDDRRTRRIPFVWNSGYQELRDLLPLSDPSLDFKFDKATQLADLLYMIGHLAAARNLAARNEPRSHPSDQAAESQVYS
jgi:two-component system, chemotaxis family, CheB/CheR fusion protein